MFQLGSIKLKENNIPGLTWTSLGKIAIQNIDRLTSEK